MVKVTKESVLPLVLMLVVVTVEHKESAIGDNLPNPQRTDYGLIFRPSVSLIRSLLFLLPFAYELYRLVMIHRSVSVCDESTVCRLLI
jgi:hypothetical protein